MRSRCGLCLVAALSVLVSACAPAAPAAPTPAPAKPTEPAKPASPAASPAASPSPSPSPAASPAAAPAPKPAASSWRPQRPIEFVVQAAAGGGSDIFARKIADILTRERIVEQPVTVVNKPGGSGAVAYAYLNEKKGDPHFIATATGTYLTTPIQGQSPVSYRDFTNYAVLAAEDVVAVVRGDAPYRSLTELVEAARARPNGIRFGGSSVGSIDSIAQYRLEKAAGVKFNYITFNSGGEVNAALLGGSVDLATPNPSEANELIKAGRLRALAVFSPERLANFPDIPTAREQGFNVVVEQFRGVVGPGGVTQDQALFWESALERVFNSSEFQAYLKENSLRPLPRFGQAALDYIANENEQLTQALREMGVAKP